MIHLLNDNQELAADKLFPSKYGNIQKSPILQVFLLFLLKFISLFIFNYLGGLIV